MASLMSLPSLPMLLAHLLAALAAGWLLRRGDIALLRLVRLSAQGRLESAGGALVRPARRARPRPRPARGACPEHPATWSARAAVPPRTRPRPQTASLCSTR